jgi:hypothetical protein
VDSAQLGIANPESAIGAMAIRLLAKIAMELENVFLKRLFEFRHVWFIPLVALENIPCGEQIFWRDYQLIRIFR